MGEDEVMSEQDEFENDLRSKRLRLRVLAARLRSIEYRELVDQIVTDSKTDEELFVALSQPPLELQDFEAEAALVMRVWDRSPRHAAKLRKEMNDLMRELGEQDR